MNLQAHHSEDFTTLCMILKHSIGQNPLLLHTCTSLPGWIKSLETYIDKNVLTQHLVRRELQDIIVKGCPFDYMAVHILQHFQRLPIGNGSLVLYQLQLFIFAVSFCNRWLNKTIIVEVCVI